ncbi:methyl-accepting chemotaxis protein [Pseudomonas sp. TWI672]|uniref:methyl-accepting chemotaxis protein n=1 Tax=unclassified Pseudomonas TaxID=196821 RepID=UPI0032084490
MLHSILSTLINQSVGKKLLMGFGLVSALSLAAIALAIHSASLLMDGNRQIETISEINLLLLQARGAEKDFALSHGDENAQALSQKLDALEKQVDELLNEPTTDHQILRNIRSTANAYQGQFDQFVVGTQKAKEALSAMQKQADEARIQFEFVEMDMYTTLRASMSAQESLNPDTLTFAENASALLRQMMALRSNEFSFTQLGDGQSLKTWEELMQGTQGDVARLHERIGQDHDDILQAAEEALGDYRASFQHYEASRKSNEVAAQKMRDQAQQVLQLADEALSNHKQWMAQRAGMIMRLLIITAIVITGLALLAGYTIHKLILPPLRQALTVAKAIAKGDLTHEISTSRCDELGQLCQAMDDMTSGLRSLIQRIGQGVNQLHYSAHQLQQASLQNSDGARNQQQVTEQAATATQQMAYSAEAVLRHAEGASSAAERASRQARAGDEVVRHSADQISRLAADVNHSMQTIQRLHEGSDRIGSVLDVIKAVAEQTNLLALNAAIEAARAGNQGRGFAVVADEVRALARRTQSSTIQIEALIAELQTLSEQAVEQMANSAQLSKEVAEQGERTHSAISEITVAVSSIQSLNSQIASAAEEQSSVAGKISKNVDQVRLITDQGVTATASIAHSSSELANLGGELQQLVRQFQV